MEFRLRVMGAIQQPRSSRGDKHVNSGQVLLRCDLPGSECYCWRSLETLCRRHSSAKFNLKINTPTVDGEFYPNLHQFGVRVTYLLDHFTNDDSLRHRRLHSGSRTGSKCYVTRFWFDIGGLNLPKAFNRRIDDTSRNTRERQELVLLAQNRIVHYLSPIGFSASLIQFVLARGLR